VSITADNEILLGAVEQVRRAVRNAGIERIEYRGVDLPFIKADVMPTFEGGDLNSFRMWVMTQLRYPKEWVDEGLSGRVIVGFVVDKEGYIDENRFTVYRTPDSRLSDEVIRVIKLSPRWTAGKQDGEAVDVKFTIPVAFNAKITDAPASSENTIEPIVVTRY
jgi:protein TonB